MLTRKKFTPLDQLKFETKKGGLKGLLWTAGIGAVAGLTLGPLGGFVLGGTSYLLASKFATPSTKQYKQFVQKRDPSQTVAKAPFTTQGLIAATAVTTLGIWSGRFAYLKECLDALFTRTNEVYSAFQTNDWSNLPNWHGVVGQAVAAGVLFATVYYGQKNYGSRLIGSMVKDRNAAKQIPALLKKDYFVQQKELEKIVDKNYDYALKEYVTAHIKNDEAIKGLTVLVDYYFKKAIQPTTKQGLFIPRKYLMIQDEEKKATSMDLFIDSLLTNMELTDYYAKATVKSSLDTLYNKQSSDLMLKEELASLVVLALYYERSSDNAVASKELWETITQLSQTQLSYLFTQEKFKEGALGSKLLRFTDKKDDPFQLALVAKQRLKQDSIKLKEEYDLTKAEEPYFRITDACHVPKMLSFTSNDTHSTLLMRQYWWPRLDEFLISKNRSESLETLQIVAKHLDVYREAHSQVNSIISNPIDWDKKYLSTANILFSTPGVYDVGLMKETISLFKLQEERFGRVPLLDYLYNNILYEPQFQQTMLLDRENKGIASPFLDPANLTETLFDKTYPSVQNSLRMFFCTLLQEKYNVEKEDVATQYLLASILREHALLNAWSKPHRDEDSIRRSGLVKNINSLFHTYRYQTKSEFNSFFTHHIAQQSRLKDYVLQS